MTGANRAPITGSQEQQGFGLHGKQVVVTRPISQSNEMAKILIDYGAVPILYPCIQIVAPKKIDELDHLLLKAADHTYEWLIVTSANTVEAIAERLIALDIVLRDLKIAAIGPKSAASVRKHLGLKVHFVASEYEAGSFADEIEVTIGQRFLLPQSEKARPILAERLRQKGAIVSTVVAYRTVIGEGGDDVPSLLMSGQIEAITFTSASTVHFFLRRLEYEGARVADLDGICLAAIGPVTADALREVSLSPTVIPARYTAPAMVEALLYFFLQTRNRDL